MTQRALKSTRGITSPSDWIAPDQSRVRETGAEADTVEASIKLPVILFFLAVLIPFSFDLGPVVITSARLVLIVLILPMLGGLLSGKCGRLLPTDIFFALHIFWATVALGVNNPDRVMQNIGSTGIEFLGSYLLGRAYIRNRADMIALMQLLIFVICLTLPLALFEAITGKSLLIELLRRLPLIDTVSYASSEIRMGLHRVQLGYSTPIHYGLLSMLGLSFCFIGLKGVWGRVRRMILFGALGACVFLSLSSGALLPALLQVFLILWAAMFCKVERRWGLLLGLFVLAYVVIDLASNRSPYRVFMSYATFSPGTAYWRAAINEFGMDNVLANPVFGIGLNDWVRPEWMHSSSIDNFWLVMAMRYGIPGFLLVAAGYATALWQVGRAKLGSGLLDLRRAWMFTFACLALSLITVHVWSEIYAMVFFLMGAGMWLVDAGRDQDGMERRPPARAGTTLSSRGLEPRIPVGPLAESEALRYSRFPPNGNGRA